MDLKKVEEFVAKHWDESALPQLIEFVKVPNQSPAFDKAWATNGHMDKAMGILVDWVKSQNIPDLTLDIIRTEGRTPLILIEIPAQGTTATGTVLLYGHLDKQPPLDEALWGKDLGPYKPVIRGDYLYGRGSSDDGYAIFAAITAIMAIKAQGGAHARCVILIEASEESDGTDLTLYIEEQKERIGDVNLVVCLDSGAGNESQLWLTTTLRGVVNGSIKVEVLREGQHSGESSGIVPSSFRILRKLLDRIEDADTGKLLVPELYTEIPAKRLEQAKRCAEALGQSVISEFPWVTPSMKPTTEDVTEAILNRTWRPTLSYIGESGMPDAANAGNVLRPFTTIVVSFRLPPRVDGKVAMEAVKKILEENPPYNAKVTFEYEDDIGNGWDAPEFESWLEKSYDEASNVFFGSPANFLGVGGSIPLIDLLGRKYPKSQFCVTGVGAPGTNAHGVNENLSIPLVKKVTMCVAKVVNDHAIHHNK